MKYSKFINFVLILKSGNPFPVVRKHEYDVYNVMDIGMQNCYYIITIRYSAVGCINLA